MQKVPQQSSRASYATAVRQATVKTFTYQCIWIFNFDGEYHSFLQVILIISFSV